MQIFPLQVNDTNDFSQIWTDVSYIILFGI